MTKTPTGRNPILTDNSLNTAFSIKYFIYFLFGISGVVVAVPSIAEVAGELFAALTAGVVAISALVCSLSSYMSRFSTWWQKVEFYSTIVLISFVLVYVSSLVYLAVTGHTSRINIAIIAIALLVMPGWRLRYLLKNQK